MRPRKVAVIGAGISGLVAAYRLRRLAEGEGIAVRVTLYDAAEKAGGVIRTEREGGFLLEGGPDSFLSIKPAARQLCVELGLEDQLIGTNEKCRKSFIVRKGKLIPVPQGFYMIAPGKLRTFAGSGLLSLRGKLRALGDLVLPRRNVDGDESVAGFIRRRFGEEVLENIGQPMIAGIYSADPERLSLKATFPVFQSMEREHRSIIQALRKKMASSQGEGTSGPRYSMFLTLKDGLDVLVNALADAVGRDHIRLASPVENLRRESVWKFKAGGIDVEADVLCLAVSPPAAARLLEPSEPAFAHGLKSLTHASVATVALGWKKSSLARDFEGFGFVVPRKEEGVLTGCTFSSMKYAGRAPEDSVLLRVFLGENRFPGLAEASNEAVLEAVLKDLERLLGIREAPCLQRVWKWRESMPQYHVGHTTRVAGIEGALTTISGLFLAGNGYSGIGIPDCIKHAENTSLKMMNFLKSSTPQPQGVSHGS